MGGQLSLFFSEASEVVLIYLIKYERSCLSEHRKAVQWCNRSCNSLRKLRHYMCQVYPACVPSRNVTLSGIDKMNDEHLKSLGNEVVLL